ncbi:hypothetical protein COO91_02050 [Nostoc flagelliforme CCNUN1]|uniref:Uncharacterized protein n=1 Tax=Nostoc flagelliforme CCNUN1 TaxID=2038116 RepID=A0A2K8SL31_9NOSO|nr:hypothetical protein [Nostoc flagelliforme]AUB36149.1 hypothetical protein COO91_02050 [Nostoc flagelliforme CCNUN1]
MTFSLNLQAIVNASQEAFEEANREIGEMFQAEVPVRTGALKGSYELTFPEPGIAEHQWNKEYSAYVHEDVTYKDGRTREGRHWTRNGLAQYQEIYERKLREKLQ